MNAIIDKLLDVRGARPGKQVNLVRAVSAAVGRQHTHSCSKGGLLSKEPSSLAVDVVTRRCAAGSVHWHGCVRRVRHSHVTVCVLRGDVVVKGGCRVIVDGPVCVRFGGG